MAIWLLFHAKREVSCSTHFIFHLNMLVYLSLSVGHVHVNDEHVVNGSVRRQDSWLVQSGHWKLSHHRLYTACRRAAQLREMFEATIARAIERRYSR